MKVSSNDSVAPADGLDLTADVFQNVISKSKNGYEIIDRTGLIIYSNLSVRDLGEYNYADVVNKNIFDFFEAKEQTTIRHMIKNITSNPSENITTVVPFVTKDGRSIYLEIYMSTLEMNNGHENILVNFRNVTKKIKMKQQIYYNVTYDQLTKCRKRDCFLDTLNDVQARAEQTGKLHALIMIDISAIKSINFPLGDNAAEQLIIAVVHRLKTLFKNDSYIGRYSEDTFAVIAEGRDTNREYEALAREVLELFARSFKIQTYEFIVNVNIGICIFPEVAHDDELTLSDKVIVALNRSKRTGVNTYKFYSRELNIRYYKESVLRSDICHAIDKEQLELYYQPIVNLKDSKIIGAEAMIRWNHPKWGLISSGEFISIAEESGLIIELGKWVITEACKSYKSWITNKFPQIKLSVNISGIQFLEEDFIKNTLDIIDSFRLDPSFLIMEITESVFIKNNEKVKADIDYLRSVGISIAIDDFGSGYSSITCLNDLNIDVIKLNKALINKVPSQKTASIILKATIDLAKELKIEVIAGGLAKCSQLSYLKSLNCKFGQGQLYKEPQQREKFEALLKTGRCRPQTMSLDGALPGKVKREFFRLDYYKLLEADLTILELGGKTIDVGNTKALIQDMGPGGLSFFSNIKLPIRKDLILNIKTELAGKAIEVYGSPVWIVAGSGAADGIYEYGLEFQIDETDRDDLIPLLNDVQIKMRNNVFFAEGNFISEPCDQYFNN